MARRVGRTLPEEGHAPRRRMRALRVASRTERARLKRKLKDGGANIAVLLRDPPDYILTAKVSDMLLAVPKYGQVKVNKILAHCRISPSKTIGGLSERQRRELIGHLIKR